MSTIDIYSVIRQAKVQGLKAQDVVDIVNEFINIFTIRLVLENGGLSVLTGEVQTVVCALVKILCIKGKLAASVFSENDIRK